jgi:hypothetical protein
MLSIEAPESPAVMRITIPIFFNEVIVAPVLRRSTVAIEPFHEDEILAADPPIDRTIEAMRQQTRRRIREREDEWKSVAEWNLQSSVQAKPTNDKLFSTHIDQRGTPEMLALLPKVPIQRQILDIVINVMSREDYRDVYGSIDTYAFEVENSQKGELEPRLKEEVADILGNLIDRVISDEQEKRLSLRDAKLRQQHVPLFQQRYKTDPVVELERQEVPSGKLVDQIEEFLHGIINEVILEAGDLRFPLTKNIIHVSGFRGLE